MPSPSTSKPAFRVRVGMAKTSPAAKNGGRSTHGCAPANTTSLSHPERRAPATPAPPRRGPSPTISTAASGTWRRISGSDRISMSWPLRSTSRETQTTTGRSPSP